MYRGHTFRVETFGFQSKSCWISSTEISQGNVPLPCKDTEFWVKEKKQQTMKKKIYSKSKLLHRTNLCKVQVFKGNVTHFTELKAETKEQSESEKRKSFLTTVHKTNTNLLLQLIYAAVLQYDLLERPQLHRRGAPSPGQNSELWHWLHLLRF